MPDASFIAGEKLKICEYHHFSPVRIDVSSLVSLPPEELKQLENDSVAKEKAIYSRVLDAVQEWKQQADRTLAYRKAQEYLKINPVSHTSNQIAAKNYGWHEISNMVYKFTWKIEERTRRNQGNTSILWEVSWYLTFNTIPNPDNSGPGWQITGQSRKLFKDKTSIEKYLNGRIAAYAHLFTEISPPVPADARKRFCVNGVLLPGYTVAAPELTQPDKKTVEDLLALLDDEDVNCLPQPEEPPSMEFPRKHSPKKASPQKSGPVR